MAKYANTPAPSANTLQRAVLFLAKRSESVAPGDPAYALAAVLFGKTEDEIRARVLATVELLK